MTFPEQILNVPLALVEQGWRREPPRAVQLAWDDDRVTDPNRLQRWSTCVIRVRYDVEAVHIWRPEIVGAHSNATAVYSHAGWGDGLAPTPEMCKVWKYWWLRDPRGDLKVCRVQVYSEQDMETADYWIGDRIAFYSEIPEWGTWAGPILPPMRQS